MRRVKKTPKNFPYDQKKFATLRILRNSPGNKSNISKLLHQPGLLTAHPNKFRLVLAEMKSDKWITIRTSDEHAGAKIIELTTKGAKIVDALNEFLEKVPELEKETMVFRMSKDEEE